MTIKDLKELEKLIKLCRRTGVEYIEADGIKLNLGDAPVYIQPKPRFTDQQIRDTASTGIAPGGITEEIKIATNGLTEEQLLYYSAVDHSGTEQ